MTQLPNDLMTTFLDLCNPFCCSLSSIPSEEGWDSISRLSKLHGVTAFLFYRTRSLGIPLPERTKKEWVGYYLYNLAQEQRARRQIKELKKILDPEGIPVLLLKGASAMMRLYPEPGLRTFVDLDILIPVDKASQFKNEIVKAAYKPLGTMYSPEFEDIQKFDNHLDPYSREDSLTVEPHVSILGGMGDYPAALPEIWLGKESTSTDGIRVEHLGTDHFIIHMLVHCAKDLLNAGSIQMKGLVDIFYALRKKEIDWSEFSKTARRWGVEKEILPILATMNHYWHVNMPLTNRMVPLGLETLLLGTKDKERKFYERTPARYIKHLFQARELPDVFSRVRYLFHLFFPTRENLRWRYGLSSEESLTAYHLLHPLLILRNFSKGLWFRLMIKTK